MTVSWLPIQDARTSPMTPACTRLYTCRLDGNLHFVVLYIFLQIFIFARVNSRCAQLVAHKRACLKL
jgi:hypothetical protein